MHSNAFIYEISLCQTSSHKTHSNGFIYKISLCQTSSHKTHSNGFINKISLWQTSSHKMHSNAFIYDGMIHIGFSISSCPFDDLAIFQLKSSPVLSLQLIFKLGLLPFNILN